MQQDSLRSHLATLPLYTRLVSDVLPALSGVSAQDCPFELIFVGRSDVRQASFEVAVLTCATTREVAVVWLPNMLFRQDALDDPDAEVSVHVYSRRRVVVSTAAVLHSEGTKDALILVLPDGQTASGTREVRIAVTDDSAAVGAAVQALRLLAA